MTRIAIIPTLTDGRYGLWSVARSEGRIPMNWGALLAANGYDIVVVSGKPIEHIPPVPNVTYLSPDDVGEVDFVLYGSTSRAASNWTGFGTIKPKRTIRIQWPTGGHINSSDEIIAVPHPCVAKQVASECGISIDKINVLPSPSLPLSWWRQVCAIEDNSYCERTHIIWAARDAFGDRNGGSYVPYGIESLAVIEKLIPKRGLTPFVLSEEQLRPEYGPGPTKHTPIERLHKLGAKFTSTLPLGSVLEAMRRSIVAITLPPIMGPTLMESIAEGCAPLVWKYYQSLFPELCSAAHKHGLLLKDESQIERAMIRLLDDVQLRTDYVESCRFAFVDHSPIKTFQAWKNMEGTC